MNQSEIDERMSSYVLDLDLRLMPIWELRDLTETNMLKDPLNRKLFACCLRYAYDKGYRDSIEENEQLTPTKLFKEDIHDLPGY